MPSFSSTASNSLMIALSGSVSAYSVFTLLRLSHGIINTEMKQPDACEDEHSHIFSLKNRLILN